MHKNKNSFFTKVNMVSEGSCDTKGLNNDAEDSALPSQE